MDDFKFHVTPSLWENLKPLARQMRHAPTPAEAALWQCLRNRRLDGAKFRRQYAIERFIVDFICLKHNLIVEVDGEIHRQQQDYDAIRELFLEAHGFHIMRVSNEAVLQSIDNVLDLIRQALSKDLTSPLR